MECSAPPASRTVSRVQNHERRVWMLSMGANRCAPGVTEAEHTVVERDSRRTSAEPAERGVRWWLLPGWSFGGITRRDAET